ncbi:hypothetical protein DEU56DRAFT_769162 [Suillus clintonianus]|uniref:uncharacterized protein n=1 Tax=Suillus clintonianus TaxID=1904413 RepID=UPI001B869681|nr:uncharacterized protein DEU56DRAFT_769162 [Suillus clintonianus]KAG2154549.1 hypothetical protein DEU56DRAFT_769162 [Suillus clintonianus]
MSSLKKLLNPEDDSTSLYHSTTGQPISASPSSPTSDGSLNATVEFHQYDPPYKEHAPHPNCPDTLACLPDTDGRPQHTLPVILRCAILGSARRRLTIREIYAAMEDKYLYFRTAGPTWKQSVRHHLSLNRLFEKQPRPVTDPGFGSYWTVNLSAPPGTKRPRKRGRPTKAAEESSNSTQQKKRGRPRKSVDLSSPLNSLTVGPGRSMPCNISAVRTGGNDHDDGNGEEDMDIGADGHEMSEDEYESEEDMAVPPHQSSLAGLGAFGLHEVPSRLLSPSTSRALIAHSDENLVDRLQIEMAGLRRQSADAISVSLKISDQLAEAQAEAARAKTALRTVEAMLEEEAIRRREAEYLADQEAKLRRAAEDTIARLRSQCQADHQAT